MSGDFTVQPVSRAVPCTEIPPVVARTGDYSEGGVNSVFAMCVLLDEDGHHIIEDVADPATGNPVQSFYSNSASGLQCNASVPTADAELSSRSSSGSSRSRTSHSHIYFAFTRLNITWPGTYRVGVDVYVWGPEDAAPYCVERVTSEQIEVSDGPDPQERPDKEERRVLKRMRNNANMNHFQLPHHV